MEKWWLKKQKTEKAGERGSVDHLQMGAVLHSLPFWYGKGKKAVNHKPLFRFLHTHPFPRSGYLLLIQWIPQLCLDHYWSSRYEWQTLSSRWRSVGPWIILSALYPTAEQGLQSFQALSLFWNSKRELDFRQPSFPKSQQRISPQWRKQLQLWTTTQAFQ